MDGGIKGEEWRINLRIRKKRKDFFSVLLFAFLFFVPWWFWGTTETMEARTVGSAVYSG